MAHTRTPDVLVVGAGPVGLTAAAELRRRKIACRIVDRLPARLPYAKAVGIQPRTLEIWDRMGLVRAVLDAAVPMRGQLTYLNGVEQPRIDLALPPEVPYGFAALPQYETERILEEFLTGFGTRIERGTELLSFAQDADGVTSRLVDSSGAEEEVRSRYLVGCDGAHSAVRKGLGLGFEGGAFPEEYMLADVEVGWDLPHGYGVRAMHRAADGSVDDVLVCIPLPGPGRYRMSMAVPAELSATRQADRPEPGRGQVAHGLEGGPAPTLAHIQTVLDRLSPRPTTARAMRWSSVFRISHRLVDRYGRGRVLVAGDAAHIHPPTGAQGMNTGIQDAYNLAWKLALAVEGIAADRLLDSYDAERHPVGAEVVGRTVRHATEGVQADPADPAILMQREAQLLVGYRDSPIVGQPDDDPPGPQAGDRAPDCTGLATEIARYPLRLYDLLRGREHVLLLYGDDGGAAWGFDELAAIATTLSHGRVETCVLLAGRASAGTTRLPVYRDARGEFARTYGTRRSAAFLVRPDGYLGARLTPPDGRRLTGHLAQVFQPVRQEPSKGLAGLG
ncbi:FAD-dependent monooxygenase [Streptomyces sp. LUP30]|uniref:FAD-dependent monooxygenase n=1 Tax=Streptomyces sp. LUP30 TaxID=1890285 RepID=UPI0008519FCE|nr:FAD-dependent monooxygenase [Streptomyces sp. LUP30]